MCALVLVIGRRRSVGARSWFGFGGFGIQPSEFAKMGAALALAWYLLEGGRTPSRLVSACGRRSSSGLPAAPHLCCSPMLEPSSSFSGFVFAMYREGLSGAVLIVGFAAVVMAVLTILSGAGRPGRTRLSARSQRHLPLLGPLRGPGRGVPSPLLRNATLPRYRMPGVPCNARHRCRHCRLAVLGGHAPGAGGGPAAAPTRAHSGACLDWKWTTPMPITTSATPRPPSAPEAGPAWAGAMAP